MTKRFQWIVLLAGACVAGTAAAQEGLVEVYRRAEASDPSLREAEANYLATLETRPQARSALLPSLSFGAGTSGSYTDNKAPLGFGNVNFASSSISRNSSDSFNLNVSQSLFDMSRLRTLRQNDKVLAQAELTLALAHQDLLVRVAVAYFGVLSAKDLLAAEVASREAIARQLEQAQRRFDVGLIAITDVQQAQAAYDNAVATEIGAQRSLASSQELLREIVGEYVTELASPATEFPLVLPDPSSPDEWVDTAMQQNLELAATRIGTEIAQGDIDILRASRLPTLDLSAGVSSGSSDNRTTIDSNGVPVTTTRVGDSQGNNFSINFRVPIYTGGLNSSRIQQAVYRHRASMEGLERVVRQTERQTRDAYLSVTSEISRVRALQQAVESSRTALRATEAGFEVGTQTTVDVLAAQQNLRRAETTYAISRYDYIVNLLRLRLAAGSLSVGDFEQIDVWLR
jgi:outer membrane protein